MRRVLLSSAADRDADQLAPEIAQRVFAAMRGLRENPRPPGCQLLREREPRTWRLRVGDLGVLYEINDAAGVVTVLRILHRSRAY